MLNPKKTLLFAGGALLLYLGFRYIKFTNQLQIDLQSIKLGGSVSMPEVYITLSMFNPTNFNVNISNVNGYLLYQDQKLANVFSSVPVTVRSGERVQLDLKLTSTIADVLRQIRNFISAGVRNEFYYQGTITVDGVTIPVKTKLAA